MTVLVIGEALVDVVESSAHAGGSPFNVAVGLARLEVGTVLAAQIADDPYGNVLREELHLSDVDLDRLSPEPGRTSSAVVTLAADGSASYEFDLTWNPDEPPDPATFEAVHVGSLGTVLEPGAELVADLVVSADALGIPVSFDPNIRLTVEPDAGRWRQVFDRIWPYVSILKLSDEDAAVLFPDEDPADLVRRLAADHGIVAVTLGGEGAVIAGGGGFATVPPADVRVVDTIGAGDSFMAAMLAWSATYDWPAGNDSTRPSCVIWRCTPPARQRSPAHGQVPTRRRSAT
ncbi:carbohydrate kinase [Aeromicrobium sp. UC242_57]|uniref:carbohydrate kinase n=1 Tax=Aeromicrobium sp. UC242_57 TaxID=3374624 RepID=UPI003792CCBA